jgi:hypothetical protein
MHVEEKVSDDRAQPEIRGPDDHARRRNLPRLQLRALPPAIQRAGTLPDLERNSFEKCEWDFIGPARDTLAFLQVLYHDHGGTDLVEKIFGLVRDRGSLARIGVV